MCKKRYSCENTAPGQQEKKNLAEMQFSGAGALNIPSVTKAVWKKTPVKRPGGMCDTSLVVTVTIT